MNFEPRKVPPDQLPQDWFLADGSSSLFLGQGIGMLSSRSPINLSSAF